MIFLHSLDHIPSDTRAIVDTNIFVYWVTDHPRFGGTCAELMQRVEGGEIKGVVTGIILNELLHRLMIAETITTGHADTVQDAVKELKVHPAIIKDLSIAWNIFDALLKMGFEILEDEQGISNLTFYFSRELSLMAKDSAIVSYAHKYNISDLITNDQDFQRVPWLTCWQP